MYSLIYKHAEVPEHCDSVFWHLERSNSSVKLFFMIQLLAPGEQLGYFFPTCRQWTGDLLTDSLSQSTVNFWQENFYLPVEFCPILGIMVDVSPYCIQDSGLDGFQGFQCFRSVLNISIWALAKCGHLKFCDGTSLRCITGHWPVAVFVHSDIN